MVKLYRGDVVEVFYPFGKGELKSRPVIILQNTNKSSDAITVYCTSQNNGDDDNNIFVLADSDVGRQMGVTKDTYIRPKVIKTIDLFYMKRPIGKCPLMQEIQRIIDKV
ncbi:MAG TPA: type II toxin-antitoxin system PemK/MazF family toxin [Pedobacter sp.]|jgi:mRNA-degrading endonuclease toxin of MazEF toxin-antitoxin module